MSLFPLNYFFQFVYYTDAGSTLFILLAYYEQLKSNYQYSALWGLLNYFFVENHGVVNYAKKYIKPGGSGIFFLKKWKNFEKNICIISLKKYPNYKILGGGWVSLDKKRKFFRKNFHFSQTEYLCILLLNFYR